MRHTVKTFHKTKLVIFLRCRNNGRNWQLRS